MLLSKLMPTPFKNCMHAHRKCYCCLSYYRSILPIVGRKVFNFRGKIGKTRGKLGNEHIVSGLRFATSLLLFL